MAAATLIVVSYIAWVRSITGGSILPMYGAAGVGALLVLDTAIGVVEEIAEERGSTVWSALQRSERIGPKGL